MRQIRLFGINERQRSPNQTNLAKTCSMFMSVEFVSFVERLRSLSYFLHLFHLFHSLFNNIVLQ